MDFFSEHIIKRKKTTQDVMSVIITFMVAFMAFYLILVQFGAGKLAVLIPIEIALVIFGVYMVISSLNVEYEYSVTNGELDIDKIIAKRKRKKFVRLNLKDVEYFALLDDKHIAVAEDPSVDCVMDASGSIDSPNVYFVIFFNNSQKVCLLFEPTKEMVENFANYIPRSLNHTI